MSRSLPRLVADGLRMLCALGLATLAASAAPRPAAMPEDRQPPSGATPDSAPRQVAADAGAPLRDMWLVIYNVLPAKAADFEAVATRVRTALAASQDPRRRQQAEGLRIHRSALPNPEGTAVYFVQVPTAASDDTDRTGLDVLIDALLPAEATALKAQLDAALDPRNPSGNALMLAVR